MFQPDVNFIPRQRDSSELLPMRLLPGKSPNSVLPRAGICLWARIPLDTTLAVSSRISLFAWKPWQSPKGIQFVGRKKLLLPWHLCSVFIRRSRVAMPRSRGTQWIIDKHKKSWRLRGEQAQRKEKKERRRLNVRVDFHRDLGLQAQRASFDRSVVSREQWIRKERGSPIGVPDTSSASYLRVLAPTD